MTGGLNSAIVGSQEDVTLVRICQSSQNGENTTANGVNQEVDDPAETWLNQAAQLLYLQWPKGGNVDHYKEKILCEPLSIRQKQAEESSEALFYGLPSSYLLIHENDCIGHGRLTECFESAGGNAAAVTFIVIDKTQQYHGFGRKLMALLEREAERLGYHYIYLWTKTAIGFYAKNGYAECQRVSLKRPCLKILESNQVESLEALLIKRRSKIVMASQEEKKTGDAPRPIGKKKETILLPPDDDDNNDSLPDVWMKKRLVEQVGSIHVAMEERVSELKAYVEESAFANSEGDGNNGSNWYYRIVSVPWQAQIGPSCGLAALRMVREYLMEQSKSGNDEHQEEQLPSLLGEAQERGFTQDGEIFNANDLREMADQVCGMNAEIWSMSTLSPEQVYGVLSKGGVFVLPYDSSGRTKLPANLGGEKAHYGIIVGIMIEASRVSNGTDDQTTGNLQPLSQEQQTLLDGADTTKVSLMVQHGLSSKLSIAPWKAFVESNAQLIGFDATKFGSVKLDLKDRIVVCRGMQS